MKAWEQIGHAQVFGPVNVPTDKTIVGNSWKAEYPDRTSWLERGLGSYLAPLIAFVAVGAFTVAVSSAAWTPVYPNNVRLLEPHASNLPSYFAQSIPSTTGDAVSTADASFGPIIPILDSHAADAGYYALPPYQAPVSDTPTGWGPSYPDFASFLPVSSLGSFSLDPFPRPPWGWSPILNEVSRERRVDVGQSVRPLNEPPDIARLGWRGLQPSWNERRVTQPIGWYARPTNEPPDIARYGWRPSYPESVYRPRPDGTGQSVRPLREPDDIAKLKWRPFVPELPGRRVPQPTGWYAYQFVDQAAIARFAWQGSQPVFINRHVPRPDGWFTRSLVSIVDPIPFYAWRGVFPVTLNRLTPDYSGWITRSLREPEDIAKLGWRGSYPTDPVQRRLANPGWLTQSLREPQDIARLNWRGTAPVAVPSRPTLPTGWMAASPYPIVSEVRLDWMGRYPVFIESKRPTSDGWYVRPLNEPPDIAKLGWRSSLPSQLTHRRPTDPPSFFALIPPTIFTDQYQWAAYYPVAVPSADRPSPDAYFAPATSPSAFSVPPLSWAPTYPTDPTRLQYTFEGWLRWAIVEGLPSPISRICVFFEARGPEVGFTVVEFDSITFESREPEVQFTVVEPDAVEFSGRQSAVRFTPVLGSCG